MAYENVKVNTGTDVNGNTYTKAISNDKLTTNDFLKLMIEELKLQDPTKPMDSSKMLSTQMQMTGIETNLATIKAMDSLQNSFAQSALSNASNIIGKNIEDGNINQAGVNTAYKVRSVESNNGVVEVTAQELLYLERQIVDGDSKVISYNAIGEILDSKGEKTGKKVALESVGKPLLKDGKPVIMDKDNNEITDHAYKLNGEVTSVYSNLLTTLPFNSITKIF